MKKQTSATAETLIKGRQIINYSGKTIYVGIDIHQKDWQVTTRCDGITRTYRMTASPEALLAHLKHYPGANFKCAYESCAWGFNLQRWLTAQGIACMVVHAADVPSTNKERVNKTDKVDARRLAEHLENGTLQAIHVPTVKQQKDRSLTRLRREVVKDLTRCRNRLKSSLKYHGIDIPEKFGKGCWSKNFMQWIELQAMNDQDLKDTLLFRLSQIQELRNMLLEIERKLREKMRGDEYATQMRLATSVPGVGSITASNFLLEIGDVRRFETHHHLNSYIGFCPGSKDSGELQQSTGVTPRKHNHLRSMFIEAAWTATGCDPAMGEAYRKLTRRMTGKDAIIRIARKLVRRLRTVLITGIEYQKGIAG